MTPLTILFASTNRGKLVEVRQIAGEFGIAIRDLAELEPERGLAPEVDESADSYEGNARLKAEAYAAWSGMITLADDTGLEVAALGGKPGVRSARYAGPDADGAANRTRLLGELTGVDQREARFVCVLVLVVPEGAGRESRAALEGRISLNAAGSGGFGYDSIFFLPQYGMTLAEAKAQQVSVETHRIKALRQLFAGLSA